MGYYDFQIILGQHETSCPIQVSDGIVSVVKQIQHTWPMVHLDTKAIESLPYSRGEDEYYLVYETSTGLIQLLVFGSKAQDAIYVAIEIRFSYCNPEEMFEPFVVLVETLMKRYDMHCQVMRPLGPGLERDLNLIERVDDVREVLLKSMSFNRRAFVDWIRQGGIAAAAIEGPYDPDQCREKVRKSIEECQASLAHQE